MPAAIKMEGLGHRLQITVIYTYEQICSTKNLEQNPKISSLFKKKK